MAEYTITVSMDGVKGDDADEAIDAVIAVLEHLSFAIRIESIEQTDD